MLHARWPRLAIPAALLALVLGACGDDGGGGGDRRTIQIVQTDDNCTPPTIQLTAGEKVTFEVKNQGSKDKEVEGIEGTRLEEVLVPAGRTRRINYTAPKDAGAEQIKCYVPGGASMVIEVSVAK